VGAGRPLPRDFVSYLRQDPASLSVLSSNMAARELLGDEAFWSDYRRRVMGRIGPGDFFWNDYALREDRQVHLMFLPSK